MEFNVLPLLFRVQPTTNKMPTIFTLLTDALYASRATPNMVCCSLFFLNFPSIHKCCTSSTDRDCNCCCCFVRPFFVAVVVVVVDFCLLAKLIFAPISLLMFFLCVGYARFGTLVNGIFGAAPLCIMSILLTLTTFQMYRSTINWIDIWIYRHSIYTFLEA